MTKYKSEFKFKLKVPIKYQKGNSFAECKELILKAPSLRRHHYIGNTLQSMFTQAMLKSANIMRDSADKSKKEESLKIENEEDRELQTKLFIVSGMGKEINDFYDKFQEFLVTDEICYLDDSTKFTNVELNELLNNNYSDFKKIVVRYLTNFFTASWMEELGMRLSS